MQGAKGLGAGLFETVWEELSMDDEEVESPEWHQKALQETEDRLGEGQEKVVDWETAKKKLMPP